MNRHGHRGIASRHGWPAAGLVLVLLAAWGLVWATTAHTIKVDGDLSDFAADEKTAGDPASDSLYGKTNELSELYVTWDATRLYLGFTYAAWGASVIYLVDSGLMGGVSNLCPNAGYGGQFPANVKGPAVDLMVGLWAGTTAAKPKPHLYTLASNKSTEITTASGVQAQLLDKADLVKQTHNGKVELGIPWSAIYGLGPGKVPPGAKLRLAGVLRGKKDGDGLGDVSPDPTGGVVNKDCWAGGGTTLDRFHLVTVDANNDGKPDVGWSPGPNTWAKPDSKPAPDAAPPKDSKPAPDHQPAPDLAAADLPPVDLPPGAPDSSPDKSQTDQPTAADHALAEAAPVGDQGPVKGDKLPGQSEGCACELAAAATPPMWTLLALLWLLMLRRRR